MTSTPQPAPRAFSTVFGFLMVAAAVGADTDSAARVAAVLAALAVVAGIRFRPVSTLAVLCTVAALVLADAAPVAVGLSGLAAAAYLVLRHAVGAGVVTTTLPTVVAAVGFTFIGVAAVLLAPALPWVPLLAPPAVLGIFLLATLPYMRRNRATSYD